MIARAFSNSPSRYRYRPPKIWFRHRAHMLRKGGNRNSHQDIQPGTELHKAYRGHSADRDSCDVANDQGLISHRLWHKATRREPEAASMGAADCGLPP